MYRIQRRQLLQALPALGFGGLRAQSGASAMAEDLLQPIKSLFKGTDPITWLFTGDSITHGALHTMGWRDYPQHFAERVRWEMSRYRDVVINTGISGDRMPGLLKDAEWRVHRFQPKVVSLMMGMNDCVAGVSGREQYRTDLEAFLNQVHARGSILLLHTPNLIYFPNDARRKDLPAYVDILRDFAIRNKVLLVDHYRHWTETRKDSNELLYLLSDGAIHPNQYGHTAFAIYLFRCLDIFDPASRTCCQFVP
jgi:acyl-CoA thioesterase I